MKLCLPCAALALFLSFSPAAAALVVAISGIPGSGTSWVSFSGSDLTVSRGTTRIEGTEGGFDRADSFEFGSPSTGNYIAAPTISDRLFAIAGNARLTVGSMSSPITDLWLDDDAFYDDLGIRTLAPLSYLDGEDVAWSGGGSIALDIGDLFAGTFEGFADGTVLLARQGALTLNIAHAAPAAVIPLPPSLGLAVAAAAALAALRATRRR